MHFELQALNHSLVKVWRLPRDKEGCPIMGMADGKDKTAMGLPGKRLRPLQKLERALGAFAVTFQQHIGGLIHFKRASGAWWSKSQAIPSLPTHILRVRGGAVL